MEEKTIPNFRILSVLLITFLAGVFVASFFTLDFFRIYLLATILSLIILAINFIFHNFLVKVISSAAVIFLAGFLLFSFTGSKLNNISLPFDQEKDFSGTISSYPNPSNNSQNFYLKTNDFGQSVKIYLSTSRFPEYHFGDKLTIIGIISKPKNFSSFDWISYLKRYGSTAEIKNPEILLISSDNGNKILSTLYGLRKKFETAVQKNLPEPESSLAAGLLIGSKQGFSESLINDFSKAGITHIIALSGYNVTIVIVFLSDILLGYISRRKIFIFSTILVIGFVTMTGAAPSVIRAAIITLLIAWGKTIGRRADMTNLILLSATVMVAINPYILRFDVGFQLSFLAFLGLVYFSPVLANFSQKKIFRSWPRFIKSALTETLAAQMFVLPLILSTFGLVSIIAPLTNILILSIIPAVMLFIFLSTLIYWLIPPIGELAYLICYLPLKYILEVARYSANSAVSAVQITGYWQKVVIVAYVMVLTMILVKFRKNVDQKTN